MQLDEDVGRSMDVIWRQTVTDWPSLTYQEVVDTGPVWRSRSDPDATSDTLRRLFDELLFYVSDQVHNYQLITTTKFYIYFNYLLVYHVIILYFSVLLLIVFYYALCI